MSGMSLPRSSVHLEPMDADVQVFPMTPRGQVRQADDQIDDSWAEREAQRGEPSSPDRGATGATGEEISVARSSNWQRNQKGWSPITQGDIAAVELWLGTEVADPTSQPFEVCDVQVYAEQGDCKDRSRHFV